MPTDKTLEKLIAAGQFAVAADRYEEQTSDHELASLMRIDGLEWELVDGVPALKLRLEIGHYPSDVLWYDIFCGLHKIAEQALWFDAKPDAATTLPSILAAAGLSTALLGRFYSLYLTAIDRKRSNRVT